MSHGRNIAVVLAVFLAIYGRSLWWGWLPIDDAVFLQHNENLGHGWASYWWGMFDLEVNRRWTPGFWLLAQLFHGADAFGYHLGTLVVGAVLVVSVYLLLAEELRTRTALVLSLLFVASPMRHEIFSWAIGFSYAAVAAFLCLAFLMHFRGHFTAAMVFAVAALLVYPQAAGAALVLVYLWRSRWQGWLLAAFVLALAFLQFALRVNRGLVPFEPTAAVVAWVVPHYFLGNFVPLATLPVTQAGHYVWLVVGCAAFAIAAAASPRFALVFVAVMAPTLLASVTEPFYWGARYSTFGAVVFLFFVGAAYDRANVKVRADLCVVLVAVCAVGSLLHVGFRSPRDLVDKANSETLFLYGHPPRWLRPIL